MNFALCELKETIRLVGLVGEEPRSAGRGNGVIVLRKYVVTVLPDATSYRFLGAGGVDPRPERADGHDCQTKELSHFRHVPLLSRAFE